MACSSSSSVTVICFSPQALARSNTRNPNPIKFSPQNPSRNPKIKLKSVERRPLPPPPPQLVNVPGGDATTYTRLPPKEDFSLPVLGEDSPWSEIKLSDSSIAAAAEIEIENLLEEGDDDEEEEEGSDDVDYKVVEVFEGSSKGLDSEHDDEDGDYYVSEEDVEEEEEEKDGEEAEVVFMNGKPGAYVYEAEDGENGEIERGSEIVNDTFDGNGEFDLGEVKEKGVPAVMRCFDRAKVFVKAGDGGNGVVAFRREKYVPLGGPSGGDGGRGGNIYVEVDVSMNSLLPFRNSVHFRAGRGAHGLGSKMSGAKGDDVVVKVPPGTVIRESGKDEVLLELVRPGQKAMLMPGGRGGRGNTAFKSRVNKAPRIAENGEEGAEMWVELELKLVADVGIIGAPNAGKSTLLSVISAAQPAIANYPFTTLLPNLGVVSFDYDSTMVVADLPGLLEGAHRGFGLGHEFLRHTERCSALVHVVDGSSPQPEFEFEAVRLELELFNPELSEKPFVVAFNKMDLPEAQEKWPSFKESLHSRGIEPFCMSAVTQQGTREVIRTAYDLQKNREANKETEGWIEPENLNHVAETIKKNRAAAIDDFEITHNSDSNSWHVVGSGLQRFIQMTNWRYIDSEKRLKHVLEACGVYKSLKKLGVKEGDTVFVGEMEMVWNDSIEDSGPSNMRKKSTNAIRWPQWK